MTATEMLPTLSHSTERQTEAITAIIVSQSSKRFGSINRMTQPVRFGMAEAGSF